MLFTDLVPDQGAIHMRDVANILPNRTEARSVGDALPNLTDKDVVVEAEKKRGPVQNHDRFLVANINVILNFTWDLKLKFIV